MCRILKFKEALNSMAAILQIIEVLPGSAVADKLGFEQTDDRLGKVF